MDPTSTTLTVLLSTNLLSVAFLPVPCPHPGCTSEHSYLAVESYGRVKETWEALPNGVKITLTTNELRKVTNVVPHQAVWRRREDRLADPVMPPLPPEPVQHRPSVSFEADDNDTSTGFYQGSSNVFSFSYKGQHVFSTTNREAMGWLMQNMQPLRPPPTEPARSLPRAAASLLPRRSTTSGLPGDSSTVSFKSSLPRLAPLPPDTNLFGVLYNVTSNYPGQRLVVERRPEDRGSGVPVGGGVERVTNNVPRGPRIITVPVPPELQGARRFVP